MNNPDPRNHDIKTTPLEDIVNAREFLSSTGHHAADVFMPDEELSKDGRQSIAVVWGNPGSLQTLQERTHLVLLDSTHKTNVWNWYLSTLMVRDVNCQRCSGAHFLVSRERSPLISACIDKICSWAICLKRCRFFLIDNSASEQLAIQVSFLKTNAGETKVDYLLFKVHTVRTMDPALKKLPNVKKHLMKAMFKELRYLAVKIQ